MKLDTICWPRTSIENMLRRLSAMKVVMIRTVTRSTANDTSVASLGRTVMLYIDCRFGHRQL